MIGSTFYGRCRREQPFPAPKKEDFMSSESFINALEYIQTTVSKANIKMFFINNCLLFAFIFAFYAAL